MPLINEAYNVLKVYSRIYIKLDCILRWNWFSFNNCKNFSKISWGPLRSYADEEIKGLS